MKVYDDPEKELERQKATAELEQENARLLGINHHFTIHYDLLLIY